jgi:Ca2+-binding RTX toxin-like protein
MSGIRSRQRLRTQSDSHDLATLQSIDTANTLQTPATSIPPNLDIIEWDRYIANPLFRGIDGSGVAIVVLDTGIDSTHPAFLRADGSSRIVYQYDFINDDGVAEDLGTHGTHVTSLAAGSAPGFSGVAAGVDIIMLGVGPFGYDDLAVERALSWVAENAAKYNIVAVNMSFGVGNNTSADEQPLADQFADLAARGVVSVAATGNSYNGFTPGVTWPAAAPAVWGIGALAATGKKLADYSQRDAKLMDFVAPGTDIRGAVPLGGEADMMDGIADGYAVFSGTSASAPHVVGAVALAQDLALEKSGRLLPVAELHALMHRTADVFVDRTELGAYDYNVLNLHAFLAGVAARVGEKNVLLGQRTADRLNGTSAGEQIFGLSGNDRIDGKAGADILDGGAGSDTISGGSGNDALIGADGSDQLFGGDGADTFDAGTGDDTINGGSGIDVVRYSNPITKFDIWKSGSSYMLRGIETGNDLISSDVEFLDFGGSRYSARELSATLSNLSGSPTGDANYLIDTALGRRIDGLGGQDTIWARGGDDTVVFYGTEAFVDGGAAQDTLQLSPDWRGPTYISGTDLNFDFRNAADQSVNNGDTFIVRGFEHLDARATSERLGVHGNNSANRILTGAGTDFVEGGGGRDVISTGEGQDWVYIDGNERSVDGGSGYDQLIIYTGGGPTTIRWDLNAADQTIGDNAIVTGFEFIATDPRPDPWLF